jgi:hypothetical protein
MNRYKLSCFLLFLLFLFCIPNKISAYNIYSPLYKQQHIFADSTNYKFIINNKILQNSLQVFDQSDSLLTTNYYNYEADSQKIIFSVFPKNYIIRYAVLPKKLKNKIANFTKIDIADSTQIIKAKQKKMFFNYDPNLRISGNKTIAISVANNADFKLEQSLFLKIDGELSENLFITAQLTDSQSPITPEGDSRELSNLDNVFLKLYGKQYELSFGDLEIQLPKTKFVDYQPKFEGFKAGWFPKNKYNIALAISKGERQTVNIFGQEAKQGPYFLSQEFKDGIKVVPGSEKLYLDGSLMQRGDDYTIDYSEGSVTFSSKHFINANSQIRVNFQASDENYRQSLYLAGTEIDIADKFHIKSSMVYQADDKENPLSISFLDGDKDCLALGGDFTVWGNGAVVSDDGDYLLSEEGYFIYVGDDEDLQGTHYIIFTLVENGDYNLDSSGEFYVYAGEGLGNYLPIRELPKPESLQNYDINVNYEISGVDLYAETLLSKKDKNTFSKLDDNDNFGFGFASGAAFHPDYDKITPDLKLDYRFISDNFNPISELNDAVSTYELTTLPDSLKQHKISTDLSLEIGKYWVPRFFYSGVIADYANQNYWGFSNLIKQSKLIPKLYYRWYKNYTEYEEDYYVDINQHNFLTEYKWPNYSVSAKIKDREDVNKLGNDEIGVRKKEMKVGFDTHRKNKFIGEIFYKYETIDSLRTTWMEKSKIDNYGINSFIKTKISETELNFAQRRINTDSITVYNMAKISNRSSFLQNSIDFTANYSLQNLQFYPKIIELEYVGEELGIYDSLGLADEHGEYDYIVQSIDYDNPKLSTEVSSDFRLNLKPQIITKSYLERFKYEAYWSITENSQTTEKTKLYFLDSEITMNDETTIFGKNTNRNTLWYNIIKKIVTFKIETNKIDILDNRYQISEKNKVDEISLSAELNLSAKSRMKFEYENRVESESRLNSESDQDSYSYELRYRITKNFTWHSVLAYHDDLGSETDLAYTNSTIECKNDFTYFWNRKYRLIGKFNYKRNKREGAQSNAYLDRNNGNAFNWDLFLNYRINYYTYASIKYQGDKNPGLDTVHKFSVEMKAEF